MNSKNLREDSRKSRSTAAENTARGKKMCRNGETPLQNRPGWFFSTSHSRAGLAA